MRRIALLALALAAASTTAAAHDYGDRIDQRQAEQARRIANARRSGELTWFERQRLLREQAAIRRMERAARSDGHISRREARSIYEAQNEASRHIYRESHDRQRAWWQRLW